MNLPARYCRHTAEERGQPLGYPLSLRLVLSGIGISSSALREAARKVGTGGTLPVSRSCKNHIIHSSCTSARTYPGLDRCRVFRQVPSSSSRPTSLRGLHQGDAPGWQDIRPTPAHAGHPSPFRTSCTPSNSPSSSRYLPFLFFIFLRTKKPAFWERAGFDHCIILSFRFRQSLYPFVGQVTLRHPVTRALPFRLHFN
jgi:hypothetical protein